VAKERARARIIRGQRTEVRGQ